MSKQDFATGGFYGKLGAVVGQRYHGKYILRTYVKTPNPRTEKQQENREIFATAVRLTQLAMNVNGHDGLWDTSKRSEYSSRMALALKRLHAGLDEDESIPLFPENYNPNPDIEINRVEQTAPNNLRIYADFSKLKQAQTFFIFYICFAESTYGFWKDGFYYDVTPQTTFVDLEIDIDLQYSFPISFQGSGNEEDEITGEYPELVEFRYWGRFENVPKTIIEGEMNSVDQTQNTVELEWTPPVPMPPIPSAWSLGMLYGNPKEVWRYIPLSGTIDLSSGHATLKGNNFPYQPAYDPKPVIYGWVGTAAAPSSVVIFNQMKL
jgi:hypothetical protein